MSLVGEFYKTLSCPPVGCRRQQAQDSLDDGDLIEGDP